MQKVMTLTAAFAFAWFVSILAAQAFNPQIDPPGKELRATDVSPTINMAEATLQERAPSKKKLVGAQSPPDGDKGAQGGGAPGSDVAIKEVDSKKKTVGAANPPDGDKGAKKGTTKGLATPGCKQGLATPGC